MLVAFLLDFFVSAYPNLSLTDLGPDTIFIFSHDLLLSSSVYVLQFMQYVC
jgi:hypothetical protein